MSAFQLKNASSHPSFELRYADLTVIVFCLTALVRPALPSTITDLGTLGGSYSRAYGINAAGQVVGLSYTIGNAGQHAFLYSKGKMTDLGTLGGTDGGAAYGINDSGQAVGDAAISGNSGEHAFLYFGGVMTDLGTLGANSFAVGINAAGQVVGYSYLTRNGVYHAFLYSGGIMSDLGTLGGNHSVAEGINAGGQVVGYSATAGDGADHAFLYSGGVMTDLGTFGSQSYAFGINAAGQVVGESSYTTNNGIYRPFLYAGGVMTDLGTLGGSGGAAFGINAKGQVVGYSYMPGDNTTNAFLYSGGTMIDLNSLLPANSGWRLATAQAINDSGQIVGSGFINGQEHAFLLNTMGSSAPTTSANASPGPNGNGWNNTDVAINLNAADNPGGSGVKQIQFALGGAQNTGWQTVAGNTASVTISAEGATTLSYFATDNAGNQETAKRLTVRIDKTPPVITPQINGTLGNYGF